ncbi:MAG: hypothetical protein JXA74_12430 [Anaerolineae bacterium]|nr:hypothetical protein [Anaerolineae bacterium]
MFSRSFSDSADLRRPYGEARIRIAPMLLLLLCLVCFCALIALDVNAQPRNAVASGALPLKKTPAEWPPADSLPWLTRPVTITLVVTDSNGLDDTTAEYIYSTDAGLTWSVWRPITQTHAPIASTLHFTVSLSALPDDDGQRNLMQFQVIDLGRTEELSPIYPLRVDASPPSTSHTLTPPLPAAGWYSDSVDVALIAQDVGPSGIAETRWRRGGEGLWQLGTAFVADATDTYEYHSLDVAGNWEPVRSFLVQIDRQPPTTTLSLTSASPPMDGWYGHVVTATFSAEDDASGEAIVFYRLDLGPWLEGTELVITESGIYNLEYRARDAAGNWEAVQSEIIRIDQEAPIVTAEADKPGQFVQPPVTVTFTASDAGSGVASTAYRLLPDGSWTANAGQEISVTLPTSWQDGLYRLAYHAEDHLGHLSESAIFSVTLDATAPTCSADLDGPLSQYDLFYTGPVSVTVRCEDGLSGVSRIHYRIEAGDWQTHTLPAATSPAEKLIVLSEEDERQRVFFRATDLADNASLTEETPVIRIDSQAPGSPIGPAVDPAGWSEDGLFDVTWTNPSDASGVGKAYYKYAAAPGSNEDYDGFQELGPQAMLSDIELAQEGETPLFIWLGDRAGNVAHTTAVSVTLRYDGTGPHTIIQSMGTEGQNGWYISTVTVRAQATDALSGVAATYYRLDGSPAVLWQGDLVLDEEGAHTLEYYSVDKAGQGEPIQTATIKLDLTSPNCALELATDYVPRDTATVTVGWNAVDAASGVENLVIETKRGCASWSHWRTVSEGGQGAETFTGLQPGYFQFFRARATDMAGHVAEWPADAEANYVYCDALVDGGFDRALDGDWNMIQEDELRVTRAFTTTHTGAPGWMAVVGAEWYEDDSGLPEGLPEGKASLWQRIGLPQAACGGGLMLTYRYRILTYDVAYGKLYDDRGNSWFDYIDTFEVSVLDSAGREVTKTRPDGNRWDYCGFDEDLMQDDKRWREGLEDSRWRVGRLYLSRYAGQEIRVMFSVWNRHDDRYPTWVYLDDVQLHPTSPVQGQASIPILLGVPAKVCPPELSQASPTASGLSAHESGASLRPSRR